MALYIDKEGSKTGWLWKRKLSRLFMLAGMCALHSSKCYLPIRSYKWGLFFNVESKNLCFVDRASPFNSCKQPTWRTILFMYIFIPIFYMSRAPVCSSSGESIVLIRHLVYVSYVGDRQVCRFGWNSVSSTPVFIIRRINCVNTTSGICHCM